MFPLPDVHLRGPAEERVALQSSSTRTFSGLLYSQCLIRALVTNCHVTLVVQVLDGCYPMSSFQTGGNALLLMWRANTSDLVQQEHF